MARRREGERETIQPRRRPARASALEVEPVERVTQVFSVPEGDNDRMEGGAVDVVAEEDDAGRE